LELILFVAPLVGLGSWIYWHDKRWSHWPTFRK